MDVVLDRLPTLLDPKPEVMCIPRPLVRALKVLDEGLVKILPIVDTILMQAIKPRRCRVIEHQGKVAKGDTLITSTHIAHHKVVEELGLWLGSAIVFVDAAPDSEL